MKQAKQTLRRERLPEVAYKNCCIFAQSACRQSAFCPNFLNPTLDGTYKLQSVCLGAFIAISGGRSLRPVKTKRKVLLKLYAEPPAELFLAQNASKSFGGRSLPGPVEKAYSAPTDSLAGLNVWGCWK